MEADAITFTLNGINYRISSHIWRRHRDRVGLVTVENIRETIRQPDFQEDESESVTRYWKWFPEMGSGNYLRVIVKSSEHPNLVITAYPDESQRQRRGMP